MGQICAHTRRERVSEDSRNTNFLAISHLKGRRRRKSFIYIAVGSEPPENTMQRLVKAEDVARRRLPSVQAFDIKQPWTHGAKTGTDGLRSVNEQGLIGPVFNSWLIHKAKEMEKPRSNEHVYRFLLICAKMFQIVIQVLISHKKNFRKHRIRFSDDDLGQKKIELPIILI